MNLVEKLQALSGEVEWRLPAASRSEANTSQFLVMPFFEALEFSVHNPNHVEPEFTADVGIQRERVDFALKQDGSPVILVEVKYDGATLDNQHAAQLRRYFSTKLDLRFGILTNGLQYRFFSDLERPNVMDDDPFLLLDLQNLDETLIDVVQNFTRTGFDRIKAINAARLARDGQLIRRVLKAEFEPLSIRTINYLLGIIQPGEVDESRRIELTRLVKQEWQAFVRAQGAGTEAKTGMVSLRNEGNDKPINPVPKPPPGNYIPVYGCYEGHRLEAELLRKSIENGLTIAGNQIRFNGETTWLKDAAVKAIRSVDPHFEPTKTYPNGFKFWHVVDPDDGKEHMIRAISGWNNITDEALRQRVLEKS